MLGWCASERETQIVCVPRRIILFECHCCFYTSSFIVAAVTTFGKEQRAALSSCHLTNADIYIGIWVRENPVAESDSWLHETVSGPPSWTFRQDTMFVFLLCVVGLDATFIFLVLDIWFSRAPCAAFCCHFAPALINSLRDVYSACGCWPSRLC